MYDICSCLFTPKFLLRRVLLYYPRTRPGTTMSPIAPFARRGPFIREPARLLYCSAQPARRARSWRIRQRARPRTTMSPIEPFARRGSFTREPATSLLFCTACPAVTFLAEIQKQICKTFEVRRRIKIQRWSLRTRVTNKRGAEE